MTQVVVLLEENDSPDTKRLSDHDNRAEMTPSSLSDRMKVTTLSENVTRNRVGILEMKHSVLLKMIVLRIIAY